MHITNYCSKLSVLFFLLDNQYATENKAWSIADHKVNLKVRNDLILES